MKLHKLSNAQRQKMEKYLRETNRKRKYGFSDIFDALFIC